MHTLTRQLGCPEHFRGRLHRTRASAAVVDFSTLPGSDGGTFLSYQQNGFEVTIGSINDYWYNSIASAGPSGGGNPAPSIYTTDPDVGVSVTVKRIGGGLFTFQSVDMAVDGGYHTQGDYSIKFYNNNVFVSGGSGGSVIPGAWVTELPGSSPWIDEAVFGVYLNTANSFGIDNINVTAVPEPESYALMVGGLALLAAVTRRRRT